LREGNIIRAENIVERDSRGHALMQSQRGAGETRARPLQETQFGGGTTKSESRARCFAEAERAERMPLCMFIPVTGFT
jgi:hypothetical protein